MYLRAKEKALNNHYAIWLRAYPNIPLIQGVVERATAETQLSKVASEMGTELADILDFLHFSPPPSVRSPPLDDHYQAIRHIARA